MGKCVARFGEHVDAARMRRWCVASTEFRNAPSVSPLSRHIPPPSPSVLFRRAPWPGIFGGNRHSASRSRIPRFLRRSRPGRTMAPGARCEGRLADGGSVRPTFGDVAGAVPSGAVPPHAGQSSRPFRLLPALCSTPMREERLLLRREGLDQLLAASNTEAREQGSINTVRAVEENALARPRAA